MSDTFFCLSFLVYANHPPRCPAEDVQIAIYNSLADEENQ